MATSRRERELARRRFERQAARRAAARRRSRRRNSIIAGVVVLVLAVAGTIALVAGNGSGAKLAAKPSPSVTASATASASASPAPSASASGRSGPVPDGKTLACYQKTVPAPPATQKFTSEPPLAVDTAKSYVMKIDSTCGLITVALNVKAAPHTVNSFSFLADKHFFDGDECHRVVTSDGLTVLQCGDPTATGSGGPGYTIPDENLTGATYPRGTIAMANTGAAHTGGSQFFLVDRDSKLPPTYTPFGTITGGLSSLDKIISHGVAGGGTDGRPGQRIFIKSLTVVGS